MEYLFFLKLASSLDHSPDVSGKKAKTPSGQCRLLSNSPPERTYGRKARLRGVWAPLKGCQVQAVGLLHLS